MKAAENKMSYRHCCVDLSWNNPGEVEALIEFKDNAHSISRKTFCQKVSKEDREALERRLGYVVGPAKDLHCKHDYHVGYLSGTYHGKPAVAMVHSAIEYMFGGGSLSEVAKAQAS